MNEITAVDIIHAGYVRWRNPFPVFKPVQAYWRVLGFNPAVISVIQ